jgi:hypothetical protein
MNLKIQKAVSDLAGGQTILWKEGGNSMTPTLKSGQPVELSPPNLSSLKKKDIVFCKVRGNYFCHKITAIRGGGPKRRFQISNNHGHVNGWIGSKDIFGIITKILPVGTKVKVS